MATCSGGIPRAKSPARIPLKWNREKYLENKKYREEVIATMAEAIKGAESLVAVVDLADYLNQGADSLVKRMKRMGIFPTKMKGTFHGRMCFINVLTGEEARRFIRAMKGQDESLVKREDLVKFLEG